MPFANQAQRAVCWRMLKDDIENGEAVKWDCTEFESGPPTKYPSNYTDYTIRTGKRGGKYIVYKGYVVYVDRSHKERELKHSKPKFTKAECRRWLANKTVNPVTGRAIKKNGTTYNFYADSCLAHDI